MVINKADGDNLELAKKAAKEYQGALNFMPPSRPGWNTKILHCSALEETNLSTIWENIGNFMANIIESGNFEDNRKQQLAIQFEDDWIQALRIHFENLEGFKEAFKKLEKQIIKGEITSIAAADMLFKEIINRDIKPPSSK